MVSINRTEVRMLTDEDVTDLTWESCASDIVFERR
jgi:hypothetical protein